AALGIALLKKRQPEDPPARRETYLGRALLGWVGAAALRYGGRAAFGPDPVGITFALHLALGFWVAGVVPCWMRGTRTKTAPPSD
ncbi:MAG: hypothetical protein HY320_12340, partial [Armatimonadetes bacterium]|nr:hypothetical protein [Armatimonadota bacterium]